MKRLLRQTLSHDDEMIEVHSLAELILSEGVRLAAGSSIKTDGEESDPWGLVGVVDIAKHRVSPSPSSSFPYCTDGFDIGEPGPPPVPGVPARVFTRSQSDQNAARTVLITSHGLSPSSHLFSPPTQSASSPNPSTIQDAAQ